MNETSKTLLHYLQDLATSVTEDEQVKIAEAFSEIRDKCIEAAKNGEFSIILDADKGNTKRIFREVADLLRKENLLVIEQGATICVSWFRSVGDIAKK